MRHSSAEPSAGPHPPAHIPAGAGVLALNANVLVLNKFYQAIRVINVRRAFSLLCREMAEVIHIETDARGQSKWHNLSFENWQELSALKKEFEPDEYDRILELAPKGLASVVCCAVGYRAADDKSATQKKVRYPREQLIHIV